MGFFKQLENFLLSIALQLDFVLKLIPRLVIGAVFIPAGWGKLQSMAKTIEYFQSLHIPLASLQAPFVALCELVFGFFILVGFYTRLSCIPLITIMVVAMLTARKLEFTSLMSLAEMTPSLYAVILLCIFCLGSGTFSLEQMFFRHK